MGGSVVVAAGLPQAPHGPRRGLAGCGGGDGRGGGEEEEDVQGLVLEEEIWV